MYSLYIHIHIRIDIDVNISSRVHINSVIDISRSILANAFNPNMRNILNLKVKRRPKYQPEATRKQMNADRKQASSIQSSTSLTYSSVDIWIMRGAEKQT